MNIYESFIQRRQSKEFKLTSKYQVNILPSTEFIIYIYPRSYGNKMRLKGDFLNVDC